MAFTLAQISDTHLGAETPLFRGNFDRLVTVLGAAAPDLFVTTGDVSLNGAGSDADMVFAAEQFARLGTVHAVPGNHDVGDARAPRQPVTDVRLDRFRQAFGPGRWVIDRENWRLLGLDSQIMGAHGDEHAQAVMIEDALYGLAGRRIAVFLHKPLFVHNPSETTADYWSVPPQARLPVQALLAHPALRLVASGHLHVHHAFMRGPVSYQWAPSTAFVVRPSEQPGLPGERVTGVLLHRFGEDAVETELLAPDQLECPYLHEIGSTLYPAAS